MKLLQKFVFDHWPAVLMALIVGIIMILPHLLLVRELGQEYQGISIADVDGDYFYLARISAAYEGDYKIIQATMRDNAEPKPYTSPPLAENFVAMLAKLLGLTPVQMSVVGNFLFPFLLALVLYAVAWKLSGNKLVAMLVSLVILTSSGILFEPREILDLFFSPEALRVNAYNRPIHPQVSSLFFYTWLLALVHWFWQPRRWLLVISGTLFGLLFYTYPFSWILAAVILGVLFIIAAARRNYQKAAGLLGIGGIGVLVSIFYWINFWDFSHHPMYEEMKKRFVVFASRRLLWSDLLAFDSGVFLALFWKKFSNKTAQILGAILVSLWIVLNQQIITNTRLFPGHWHWYYVVPVTIFVLIIMLQKLLSKLPKLWSGSVFLIAAMALSYGAASQYQYYLSRLPKYETMQRYAPVYRWLHENAPRGSAILADQTFSELLPAYTPHYRYLFLATDELYLIPRERLKDTYFVKIYLQGATPDNVSEFINQNTHELREILHGYLRRYTHGCYQCYPEEEIQELRREYIEFYHDDLEGRFKRYALDYIVQDTSKNVIIDFGEYEFVELLAEVEGFKIYRVI